jgi:hypothetical protein
MTAHVIDWSSAAVQWTPEGHELTVRLSPAASERQASVIADRLSTQFATSHPAATLTVISYEPEDGKPAELTLTSPYLLSVNPHEVRGIADAVADATANEVVTAEANDAAVVEHWLRALSEG